MIALSVRLRRWFAARYETEVSGLVWLPGEFMESLDETLLVDGGGCGAFT